MADEDLRSGPTPPSEPDSDSPSEAHCERLRQWIDAADRFWRPMHRRIQRNRVYARGLQVAEEELEDDVLGHSSEVRVNLIHASMGALMPYIYARNPELSVTVSEGVDPIELRSVKAFAKTLQVVVNAQLERAGLKSVMKRCIRGAMVSKLSWIKLTYQRDYRVDPVIRNRMNDAQDNLRRLNRALYDMRSDETSYQESLAAQEEIRNTLAALEKQLEVVVQQGLVLDRIQPEHLLLDPAIPEISLYPRSRRITERIYMPLSKAQELFDHELRDARRLPWSKATPDYHQVGEESTGSQSHDPQICVHETWDLEQMSCFHQVVGERAYVREPYQPDALGERFYPWFGLWYDESDGYLVPLSRVELLRELCDEYQSTLTQRAEHREVSIPHWFADAAADQQSLRTWRSRSLGEVVLVDAGGRPIKQVIDVAASPPFNPTLYDTTPTLHDVDMIMGQHDAARGAIIKPKTATEASLLEQSRAGRADETRDTNEDVIAEIGRYAAEVLLLELDLAEVQRLAGPQAVWPELSRDDIFEKVKLDIRAGSSGRPDKRLDQERWSQLLPILERLMDKVLQLASMGADPSPYISLARETLRRYDDSLELEEFFPMAAMLPAFQPGAGMMGPGMGMGMGGPPALPGAAPGAGGALPPGPGASVAPPGAQAPGQGNVVPFPRGA